MGFRAALCFLLVALLGSAQSEIIVVSGFAATTSTVGLFSFSSSRYAEPILLFTDPDGDLDSVFSLDHLTLTLERSSPLNSPDPPSFILLNIPPPNTTSASNPALFSTPGRYGPADFDNDGTPDPEDAFPIDPSEDTDTDGDLIGNNADPDDDNDLVPDSYEVANNLDPLTDDANGNLDGDHFTNLEEYIADTLANDASSFLSLDPVPGPSPSFQFRAVSGRTYLLRSGTSPANLSLVGPPLIVTQTSDLPVIPVAGQEKLFFQLQVQLTNP